MQQARTLLLLLLFKYIIVIMALEKIVLPSKPIERMMRLGLNALNAGTSRVLIARRNASRPVKG